MPSQPLLTPARCYSRFSMTKIRSAALEAMPQPEDGQPLTSERAMRRRPGHYLDALNPEQREAVETLDGPLLVLAGAGTGKTRVLTTRIAHILSLGRAWPSQILAVTFTNKAAREMKARVAELIGGVVEGMPWLGTFHAIGVKILRRHAELVDLKPSFTVLDTDDQVRLLEAAARGGEYRREALAGARARGDDRRLEEPGLVPKRVPEGESLAFAQRQSARALRALSAAAERAERRRFRRSPAREFAAVPGAPRRARKISAALPVHAGRRVSGFQRRPISVAQAARARQPQYLLRRRRRSVDLRLARRRGRQHPQVRDRLPRRQDHQARAQLPFDRAHPRRGLGAHRPQQGASRQDAPHRRRAGRQGRGRGLLGRRGGSPRHRRGYRAAAAQEPRFERDRDPGARLVPDARLRGPLHHARPPLSRHRRPPLLRAPGDQGRDGLFRGDAQSGQRPQIRAHLQYAAARPRRIQSQIAASARPRAKRAAVPGGAAPHRDRGAQAQAAQGPARPDRSLRPLALADRHDAAHRARRADPR